MQLHKSELGFNPVLQLHHDPSLLLSAFYVLYYPFELDLVFFLLDTQFIRNSLYVEIVVFEHAYTAVGYVVQYLPVLPAILEAYLNGSYHEHILIGGRLQNTVEIL